MILNVKWRPVRWYGVWPENLNVLIFQCFAIFNVCLWNSIISDISVCGKNKFIWARFKLCMRQFLLLFFFFFGHNFVASHHSKLIDLFVVNFINICMWVDDSVWLLWVKSWWKTVLFLTFFFFLSIASSLVAINVETWNVFKRAENIFVYSCKKPHIEPKKKFNISNCSLADQISFSFVLLLSIFYCHTKRVQPSGMSTFFSLMIWLLHFRALHVTVRITLKTKQRRVEKKN